jgi:hypothetical protein
MMGQVIPCRMLIIATTFFDKMNECIMLFNYIQSIMSYIPALCEMILLPDPPWARGQLNR